jgi:hypothetical protein
MVEAHETRYKDINAAATKSDTYISSIKAVVPSDPRVRLSTSMQPDTNDLKGNQEAPAHL